MGRHPQSFTKADLAHPTAAAHATLVNAQAAPAGFVTAILSI
jgi:hypothetical protein